MNVPMPRAKVDVANAAGLQDSQQISQRAKSMDYLVRSNARRFTSSKSAFTWKE